MNRFVDELALDRIYTLAELARIDAPTDVLLCFDGIEAIPATGALFAYAIFRGVDVWSFAVNDDGTPDAELLRDALRVGNAVGVTLGDE